MNPLQDRRVQLAIAAGVALLLAILLAVFLMRQQKPGAGSADVKSALQVDLGHEETKVSQTKPLRCFVGGQYVGDFPVLECAKRNGVAAQSLDVGLDPQTGQVAGGAAPLQPLPAPSSMTAPAPAPPERPAANTQSAANPAGPAECLRYSGGGWRGAGDAASLNQCVRQLFDGQCVRPGDALYGRYGALTLRVVPGRVEVSPDNRNFRTLVAQDPQDCSLPSL